MAQTSIRTSMSGALAGQIGAELVPSLIFTAVVATGKTVTPGQPAFISSVGTDGTIYVRAIENGDTIDETTVLGFVRCDNVRENEGGAGYGAGLTVSVVRKGVMWIEGTATVAAFAPVFVGNATAQLGDFDDATGTGLVQYPGAQFLMAGGDGDMIKILIDTRTSQADDIGAS